MTLKLKFNLIYILLKNDFTLKSDKAIKLMTI